MEALFLKIFNMSITASWLALAVIAVRLIMKKAPKRIVVFMWAMVGIRLICPISLKSVFSMVPSTETIPENIIYTAKPSVHSGVPFINSALNPVIGEALAPDIHDSVTPARVLICIAFTVWLAGLAAMLLYYAISYFRLRHRICEAVPLRDNIWLCDHIDIPFVMGILKPRIFLPSDIKEEDMKYVISHEEAHLKRRDNLWKPLGFLLLAVYWFNPVLWVSYILFCRDIEFACDEKVIGGMSIKYRKAYSQVLINYSVSHKKASACPVAFCETGVKERILSVLRYKKPAYIIIASAVAVCAVLAAGFLTDPKHALDKELSEFVENCIIEHHQKKYTGMPFSCADIEVLGTENDNDSITLYMWVLYTEYHQKGDMLVEDGVAHIPTVITVKKRSGGYSLAEYLEPRDGSFYVEDIREMFPWYLRSKAVDSQRYIQKQQENCIKKAEEYFSVKHAQDPTKDIPQTSSVQKGSILTLDDVTELSEKGDKLSFGDFEDFLYTETGSGLYIRHYPIDEMFYLLIGGVNTETPLYIYLQANDPESSVIDIRRGDVRAFIDECRKRPLAQNLTYGYHVCPVDNTADNFKVMDKEYVFPEKYSLDDKMQVPCVRISSVSELKEFIKKMSRDMNFKMSYPDLPSFEKVCEEYTEDFFENTTLFLVYTFSGKSSDRYSVRYVRKTTGVLSIGLQETIYDLGNEVLQGWLACIGIPNDQLSDTDSVEASVVLRVNV